MARQQRKHCGRALVIKFPKTQISNQPVFEVPVDAWIERAKVFESQGRYMLAMCIYERVLHHIPNCTEAFFNLGCCYFRMFNFKVAKDCYRQAVKHDKNCVTAWCYLANTYSALNMHGHEILALKKVVKLSPKNSEASFRVAIESQYQRKYQEAIRYYQAYLDLDPHGDHAKYAREQIHKFRQELPLQLINAR